MAEIELGRWPVALEIPVAWGDMDAFGHVNNTVYLRWCESARIAYFEKTGLLQRMQERGERSIPARASMDYRKPVVFPATVRARSTITKLGNTSAEMRYRIELLPTGEVVAEGESVLVLLDYRTGAKVPLDAELRARIAALEASGPGA